MDMEQLKYRLLLHLIWLLLKIYHLHVVTAKLGKDQVHFTKHFYQLFRTFLLILRNNHDFEHNDFQAVYDRVFRFGVSVVHLDQLLLFVLPVSVDHHLLEHIVKLCLDFFESSCLP